MVVAPWSIDALTTSSSVLFVPDPCPGEVPWFGSDRAAELVGEVTGVGSLASSASLAGTSVAALGGDGAVVAAAAGGALGGELVPSSTMAVALQKSPG